MLTGSVCRQPSQVTDHFWGLCHPANPTCSQEPDPLTLLQLIYFLTPHSSATKEPLAPIWAWLPLSCPQSQVSAPH